MGFEELTVSPTELMRQDLVRRGLDPDVYIELMGLKPATLKDLKKLGFSVGGLTGTNSATIIPVRNVDGTFNYDLAHCRLHGDAIKTLGGSTKRMRYLHRHGIGTTPSVFTTRQWSSEMLNDVTIPVHIVEGSIKAAVLCTALTMLFPDQQHIVLGIAGVDNHGAGFRYKECETANQGLHHTIRQFKFASFNAGGLNGAEGQRVAYVWFDWDPPRDGELTGLIKPRLTKTDLAPSVASAERRLCAKLHAVGAVVMRVRLAKAFVDGDKKLAVDDLVVEKGADAVGEGIWSADRYTDAIDGAEFTDLSEVKAFVQTRVGKFKQTQYVDLCTRRVFINRGQRDIAFESFVYTYEVPSTTAGGLPKVVTKPIWAVPDVQSLALCAVSEIDILAETAPGVIVTRAGTLNVWNGWRHAPEAGSVEPWLTHCKNFFVTDPSCEAWYHDWVAHIIQHPMSRHNTSPVFASRQEGNGKSYTAEAIARMLGLGADDHAAIISPGALFSQFNSEFASKIFVVANEPSSDKDDHSAIWKDLRTSPMITCNEKYGAKMTRTNRVNVVATTNMDYVTKVTDSSRREMVYKPKNLDIKLIARDVAECQRWMDEERGYNKMMNFYMTRDVSKFDPKAPAPVTAGLLEMSEDSLNPTEAAVKDFVSFIEDYMLRAKIAGMLIEAGALLQLYADTEGVKITQQHFRKALRNVAGVERYNRETGTNCATKVRFSDKDVRYAFQFGDVDKTQVAVEAGRRFLESWLKGEL